MTSLSGDSYTSRGKASGEIPIWEDKSLQSRSRMMVSLNRDRLLGSRDASTCDLPPTCTSTSTELGDALGGSAAGDRVRVTQGLAPALLPALLPPSAALLTPRRKNEDADRSRFIVLVLAGGVDEEARSGAAAAVVARRRLVYRPLSLPSSMGSVRSGMPGKGWSAVMDSEISSFLSALLLNRGRVTGLSLLLSKLVVLPCRPSGRKLTWVLWERGCDFCGEQNRVPSAGGTRRRTMTLPVCGGTHVLDCAAGSTSFWLAAMSHADALLIGL
mmetsp:Transcript_9801/g.24480  ORF Transcript_9801/g.24480 Transcript_9801/m.24480 type:complete len:272 (+) Transcript_9801:230-1045(+)